MFWEDSLDLTLLLIFFGLAISWIGAFGGLFIGEVALFRKVFLSWLRFCEVWIFIFWFLGFAWDCELLVIDGLLRFLGEFEIIFRLSGLFRGFSSNGFLFELSLGDFPLIAGTNKELSSLFCL